MNNGKPKTEIGAIPITIKIHLLSAVNGTWKNDGNNSDRVRLLKGKIQRKAHKSRIHPVAREYFPIFNQIDINSNYLIGL